MQLSILIVLITVNTGIESYRFQLPEFNSSTTDCVAAIISEFTQSSAISIAKAAINDEHLIEQEGIINDVLSKVTFKSNILLEGSHPIDLRKRYNNIFFIDYYPSFRKLYDNMSEDLFDYRGLYLIVLTHETEDRFFLQHIKRILMDLWEKYIVNVNIVVAAPGSNDSVTLMYTYFPFTPFSCGRVYPIIWNYFQGGRFTMKNEFYPNKLKNLHKCPIKLGTFQVPPYVMIEQGEQGLITLNGFEGILINQLALAMNFSLEIILSTDSWGYLSENGKNSSGASYLVSIIDYSQIHSKSNNTRNFSCNTS